MTICVNPLPVAPSEAFSFCRQRLAARGAACRRCLA